MSKHIYVVLMLPDWRGCSIGCLYPAFYAHVNFDTCAHAHSHYYPHAGTDAYGHSN